MEGEPRLKIAITGPESSGKSVLSEFLADNFDARLVKEYARSYYDKHEYTNSQEEIITIAEGQIRAEREAAKGDASLIICDSDLVNIKIWLEYYGYSTPKFILDYLASKPYDFCLLLYPNTPWVADPLRRNPNDRVALYTQFQRELQRLKYSFETVDELGELRFQQAVQFINEKFKL